MDQKLSFHFAKKGKKVTLAKNLPLGMGFGNNVVIKEGSAGYIISNGFEAGKLKVKFDLYSLGKPQDVTFNELSAANYLIVNVY